MQLEISKCYFSHNFHWSPPKLYENIGYTGKYKCLLEYCNEKFHLVNIFYLKLSQHSCVLDLQTKQSVKAPGPLVLFPQLICLIRNNLTFFCVGERWIFGMMSVLISVQLMKKRNCCRDSCRPARPATCRKFTWKCAAWSSSEPVFSSYEKSGHPRGLSGITTRSVQFLYTTPRPVKSSLRHC